MPGPSDTTRPTSARPAATRPVSPPPSVITTPTIGTARDRSAALPKTNNAAETAALISEPYRLRLIRLLLLLPTRLWLWLLEPQLAAARDVVSRQLAKLGLDRRL